MTAVIRRLRMLVVSVALLALQDRLMVSRFFIPPNTNYASTVRRAPDKASVQRGLALGSALTTG